MKKGKEWVIHITDDEPTTDHSEEEVELNNGEMMNAPQEKATSDAVKLAESKEAKRRQRYRDNDRKRREKELNYITSLEKEKENLTYSNSTTTSAIIENQSLNRRLQSLNEGYIQSSEEIRRLKQECIDLANLQQEQSRAPNAAQDPNSMLLGGPHNAACHSYGIMVPQQIQTSGSSHQQGGPHNAAHDSYGMLDTNADISDWINEIDKPGSADSMTRELGQSSASQKGVYDNLSSAEFITTDEWVESCINDFDQNVPAPHLSADDSVLGSEMPSMAQLQEGMSSTDVEKATSDAGQIE